MAVTLILATPNHITLRRDKEKDGYAAVQLALPKEDSEKDTQGRKAETGEKKPTRTKVKQRYIIKREFPLEVEAGVSVLTVEQFVAGDVVEVSGISKGKGFQGVVKRHGFKGGPASHGHRHVLRRPGSIGSRFPQHVFKGMRMAGRMGSDRVTVKNLEVMSVDQANHILAVKGAVPGTRGSAVEIRSAVLQEDLPKEKAENKVGQK